MAEKIDNTLVIQRLLAKVENIERRTRNGGPGDSGSGGSDERVTGLEVSMRHVESQLTEIKTETRRLLWAGMTAVALVFGALVTGYLRLDDDLDEISDRLYNWQISVAQSQAPATTPKPTP